MGLKSKKGNFLVGTRPFIYAIYFFLRYF